MSSVSDGDPEPTIELLARVRAGDSRSLESLCARYLPRLRRWTSGRVPAPARGFLDTEDLVQDVFVRAVKQFDNPDLGEGGALHAYLRQAILNRIRDAARRVRVRPGMDELQGDEIDPSPSPLQDLIGQELADRYERALSRLRPEEREAVVARIEMDCGYAELAELLGKPSPDAARMAVGRALVRLAEEMRRHE